MNAFLNNTNTTLYQGALSQRRTLKPKLTLVGAGPGDPELITLKAIRALANADVVLYDALANPALLEYAPKSALKKYVGKRGGKKYLSQDQINQLIVEEAFQHGHVVRLKGGDPFVFGRGHEELAFAQSFDMDTEVVPGISSSLAVPALKQIPLTKRGINESFWVITGTTKKQEISQDMPLAAQSSATVIILMGMRKLKEITAIFSQYGKQNTPVAIIQNGSCTNEKTGFGEVHNIADIAEQKGLGAPAVIVIGEVVRLAASAPAEFKNLVNQQINAGNYGNYGN
ncbi:uroporphyrinogen-III C-methyltransferase [uncultured Microscilla sp.]|uniref:uroporphyrinogen-III C-methyltransferase n=1 Tax=uncultured Microscilla sp. TaxID=432653 RepID=UPI002610E33E|nr:uroporphyrinogen-III C-methyltransferase [uncultured Microscilla sp.]